MNNCRWCFISGKGGNKVYYKIKKFEPDNPQAVDGFVTVTTAPNDEIAKRCIEKLNESKAGLYVYSVEFDDE